MTLRENKSSSTRRQIIAAVTLRRYSSVFYFVITFSYKYSPEDALKLDWPNRNCNSKRCLFKMRSLTTRQFSNVVEETRKKNREKKMKLNKEKFHVLQALSNFFLSTMEVAVLLPANFCPTCPQLISTFPITSW